MRFALCFGLLASILVCGQGYKSTPLISCSTSRLARMASGVNSCSRPFATFMKRNIASLFEGRNVNKITRELCRLSFKLVTCAKPVVVNSPCLADDVNDFIDDVFYGARNVLTYLCADNAKIIKTFLDKGGVSCISNLGNKVARCGGLGPNIMETVRSSGLFPGWRKKFCNVVKQRETCVLRIIEESQFCKYQVATIYRTFLYKLSEPTVCRSRIY